MFTKMHPFSFWCVLCLLVSHALFGFQDEKWIDGVFDQGITVDLRSPSFSDGVLTTEEGGIIQGKDIRIQAKKIAYINKKTREGAICSLIAEDEVMLEFGPYVFVGTCLNYDFQKNWGIIYNARTALEPWYFGGKQIELCPDGSYKIYDGFVTTSENFLPEWKVSSEEVSLTDQQFVAGKNVTFTVGKLPVFWLPSFRLNLDTILDNPIRYNLRWGGRQGPRIGMTYEIFSWNNWKTFLRLDYRINRGLGGGFETYYHSDNGKADFRSINYVARDSSLLHPSEKIRYRFQGIYHNLIAQDRVSIHLTYDKLSDKEMATDYHDKSLELETALRTQLHVRRQDRYWIANFFTVVRLNSFQTIKQELPSIEISWKPITLGAAKVITDMHFTASYLDFVYSSPNRWNVPDYHATRIAYTQRFYNSWWLGAFNFSPEVGGKVIYYGSSPQRNQKFLTFASFSLKGHTELARFYGSCKHVIQPYFAYQYLTSPTASPSDHYIFDIDDGWYRLNLMRYGIMQSLFCKNFTSCMRRPLFFDLFSYAFFNTHTIPAVVPKIYGQLRFSSSDTMRHTFVTTWDFEHHQIEEYNFRNDWTVNQDLALALEFRHRSAYRWRKVDPTNFILDSFRSERSLKHSSLSDRRNTLLLHLFYRFCPTWSFEFESRHGWNRRHEPSYNEFEFDLNTTIRSCWHVQLSYRHKEDDDRIAVYLTVGMKRPDTSGVPCFLPCLEF